MREAVWLRVLLLAALCGLCSALCVLALALVPTTPAYERLVLGLAVLGLVTAALALVGFTCLLCGSRRP